MDARPPYGPTLQSYGPTLRRWLPSALALVALALAPAGPGARGVAADAAAADDVAADDVVAIRVGRIITVAGDDIEGGTILIEGGRITAVGRDADVVVPWSARVRSHPTGVAMPGMIAAHSSVGLRIPNEILADVPYVSVLDGLDPSAGAVKNSLRDGITVAQVIPLNATRLGGQGAVIRLAGKTAEEMTVRSPSAMKISLEPSRGETRMQSMATLRRKFLDLHANLRGLTAEPGAVPDAPPPPAPDLGSLLDARPDWASIAWDRIAPEKIDPEWRALADCVRGKLPVFIYCGRASDALQALDLMRANRLRGTLVLGSDAHRLAAFLAARPEIGPVILDSELVVREVDPDTGAEIRHATPKVLHDAGVRFALQAAPDLRSAEGPSLPADGRYHLWYQAALLVRHGIPRAEALRSVTLTPAEILGLDHRMGTLEPGKDANVVVFSGDPLDARSWVDLVLIEGKEAYRRDTDRDLELLLREPERTF